MSSNTNTLFWVITGAVIVLGIFTLLNFSKDSTIKTVFSKFDELVDRKEETGENQEKVNLDDTSANISNGFRYKDNTGLTLEVSKIAYNGVSWRVSNDSTIIRLIQKFRLLIYDRTNAAYVDVVDLPYGRTFGLDTVLVTDSYIGCDIDMNKFYFKLEIS